MKYVDFPEILGPTYTMQTLAAESQRCVNMYVEKIESGQGKALYWLKPTPGLLSFCDLGVSPVRALYTASNGRVFAIGGNTVFELFIDGTKTTLGTMSSSLGRVQMVDNGLVLAIVQGTSIYKYTFSTSTFALHVDANYLGGSFIGFLNNFLLVNIPNTQGFQWSPVAWDGTTSWDALDISTAESSPDNIIAQVINGQEIWSFGLNSYDVSFNSEDGFNPFQKIPGASGNIGIAAPNSLLAFRGNVFWLGGSKEGQGVIFKSNGYQPQVISNFAIESQLAAMSIKDDAIAFSYLFEGHYIYAINFPSAGRTFNYDLSTGLWFETEYRVPTTNARIQHRANTHTFAFNKNLVGDFSKGIIYELSTSVYTDNGDPIIRYRRTANKLKTNRKVFYSKLQIDIETGLGLPSGQGSNPILMMRYSNDLGKTWSNYKQRSLGRQGEYTKKVVFENLGASSERIWELSVSDPIPFRIFGAELCIDVGVQ